jgi:hypothetical protein
MNPLTLRWLAACLSIIAGGVPALAQKASTANAGIERRITASPGVTLQAPFGKLPLGSYHLDMKGKQPRFDRTARRVYFDEWRLGADAERDNVSVRCEIKDPATAKTERIEGWILGHGRPGGIPYEMIGGKVDVSPRIQQQCWMRAYAWTPALSAAASGAISAGQQTLDGRTTDKYAVEAPDGALARVRPMMDLTASKGTVWLDQQTGALLKMALTYRENFTDPRGSENLIGTGDARIEMTVTRVGKTTVKSPM